MMTPSSARAVVTRARRRRHGHAIDAAANDGMMLDQLVTPEARRQGDYAVVDQRVTEGEFDGVTKGSMRVVKNRGGTAIERWINRGDLSVPQAQAVAAYTRAHRLWLGEQRVVANWSMVPTKGMTSDTFVTTRLAARELLIRLDEAVFFHLPLHCRSVWQNVVLYDEPAGVAGSRLGFANKQGEGAAKAIVIIVADRIASELELGKWA